MGVDNDFILGFMEQHKQRQTAKTMKGFLRAIQLNLNMGDPVPPEALQYLIDRLLRACEEGDRKGPVSTALGISRGVDAESKHLRMVEMICKESFRYRHKDKPAKRAIENLDLGVTEEYAARIYNERSQMHFTSLAFHEKDERRKQFYINQLDQPHRDLLKGIFILQSTL